MLAMFRQLIDRFRKLREDRVVILMYHQVCNRRCDPWELAVHPNHFYDQMQYLKENFDVVPISALAEEGRARKSNRTVAITFDDGFKDNYTNAAPVLDWHGLPATFFVATTAAQQRHSYWWDSLQEVIFHADVLPRELEMTIGTEVLQFAFQTDHLLTSTLRNQIRSWNYNQAIPNERIALYMLLWHHMKRLPHAAQVNTMAKIQRWSGVAQVFAGESATMSVREIQILGDNPLFSIGAHTVNHAMLSTQDAEAQAYEVKESKRQLEKWLAKPVDGFAYPYGNFNALTQQLLKETGFAYAVSTECRPVTAGDDPFALPRIQVKNWCVYEFATKLNEMVNG